MLSSVCCNSIGILTCDNPKISEHKVTCTMDMDILSVDWLDSLGRRSLIASATLVLCLETARDMKVDVENQINETFSCLGNILLPVSENMFFASHSTLTESETHKNPESIVQLVTENQHPVDVLDIGSINILTCCDVTEDTISVSGSLSSYRADTSICRLVCARMRPLNLHTSMSETRMGSCEVRPAKAVYSPALPVHQIYDLNFESARGRIADVLGNVVDVQDLDFDDPLMALGVDSISAVEFKENLQFEFGKELPSTLIYDYPNINSIAHLVVSGGGTSFDKPKYPTSRYNTAPHALLACSGAVAGDSRLYGSRGLIYPMRDDLSQPVPLNRWDIQTEAEAQKLPFGSASLRHAYWIGEIDYFDAEVFRIASSDASYIDPQSRLLLDHTYEVLHNWGEIHRQKTGVYVGCVWTEFNYFIERVDPFSSINQTGSGLNFSSGRVSYTFGFQGPCIGMDTACSSSLVAMHMADTELFNGHIDSGISAGTNLLLMSSTTSKLASLGSLSACGRCKTLDETADGYGRGEASIVVLSALISDKLNMSRVQGFIIGKTNACLL